MIEAIELSSARRGRTTLDQVSFDVYPGQVTALVGAAGSGKSTVLRMMAELEPCRGRTLYDGRPYHALHPAIREVGLALDPAALHPRRTVAGHLALYCAAGGVPKARIADVLEIAGLSVQSAAKCGRLDASQRQRLVIAAALLGDPAALLLDEPRGLDEHGMAWFHALLRAYAAQGRTVLVAASGPEALTGTVDHVIVLRRDDETGRTRVVASRSAAEVFDTRRASVVIARSPQASRLAALLEDQGAHLAAAGAGALEVRGLDRARIGELAHGAGICLHELAEVVQDDVFGWQALPRQKAGGSGGPVVLGEEEDSGPTAETAASASAATPAGVAASEEDVVPLVRAWRSGVRLVSDPKSGEAQAEPGTGTGTGAGTGAEAQAEPAETVLATLSEPSARERSDAVPVEAVLSAPPPQTRDDAGSGPSNADVLSRPATTRQRVSADPASQTAEAPGKDQPPVPFTVLAPWEAAVSAGERPAREEPAERPVTTPAPSAPEGRNPKPPETVPWYAAPSVVADAATETGPVSSGFAPGSNVSATPRGASNATAAPGAAVSNATAASSAIAASSATAASTPTTTPAPKEAQA